MRLTIGRQLYCGPPLWRGTPQPLQAPFFQVVPEGSFLAEVLVHLVLLQRVLPPGEGGLDHRGQVGPVLDKDDKTDKRWKEVSGRDKERAEDVGPGLEDLGGGNGDPLPVVDVHAEELQGHKANILSMTSEAKLTKQSLTRASEIGVME